MQSLKIKKGRLIENVEVPSSKSYANRALIFAAVTDKDIKLTHVPQATDVTILISCLARIGLDIKSSNHELQISGSFPACEKEGIELEVGEGGTTARFLAALLLLGKCQYTLILGERLKERPWASFIDLTRSLGAEVSLIDNRLSLKGPIKFPRELSIDCSVTTQFATAFQLIAPEGTKIIPLHLKSSVSYWKMTEEIISQLKVSDIYPVPRDWSSASYPLAYAALKQEVFFPGLHHDLFQSDAKFLDIIKKFASVESSEDGLRVKPLNFDGSVIFDVSDALDLVPTLGYFLSHIKGEHHLSGIENLVHKESDRLSEVIGLIQTFGRKTYVLGNTLYISGNHTEIHEEKSLTMPNDHRMVMVGSLFLLHHSGGTITPAEAVSKSYPSFFGLFKQTV